MSKYKMIVLTHSVEGREQEFNDWYQNIHLQDVVSIKPFFVAAQRFRFTANIVPGSPDPAPYLAIYDIETDDIAAALNAMNELVTSGRMRLSDAMAKDIVGAVYEEYGELVKG